ncbi:MAG: hypothetical protein IJP78_08025 [Clostridia bacterium]|nr:hypothetical protein [Clostridia bacterium]
MTKHIFRQETKANGPHIIIDTSEIAPGQYETMVLNAVTGDELSVARSSTIEDAEREFYAMIQLHAGRLQAAFCRAKLIPGERYTLVSLGEFGFPLAERITYHGAELTGYAQYGDAVAVDYTPFKKRHKRRQYLYNKSFMIYEGWRELDKSATFNTISSDGSGHLMQSKYACFDERFIDDIKALWPDYMIAFDYDHVRRGNDPAPRPNDDAAESIPRRPFTIADGVTVLHGEDGTGKPCVDMSAENFAALYADPQDGQDAAKRLTWALKRAAVASAQYIDHEDGGTCNFDSPALDFAACGLKKADAEQAIHDAGLLCYDWKPFKDHYGPDHKLIRNPTYLVISGFQSGQGNRHSKMAETFSESLNQEGFTSIMYYQMD